MPFADDHAAYFRVCAVFQGSTYTKPRSFVLTGRFDASETLFPAKHSFLAVNSGRPFWDDGNLSFGADRNKPTTLL